MICYRLDSFLTQKENQSVFRRIVDVTRVLFDEAR